MVRAYQETCAAVIQRGMVTRNTDVPQERRIEFRAGVNIGDVIVEDDDIYGDGVNVAARLENLSEPGGMCISRTVRDHIRDKLTLTFVDLGEHNVKNIARPVRVYGLGAADIAALPETTAAPPPLPSRRRRVGVWIGAAVATVVVVAAVGAAVWHSTRARFRRVAGRRLPCCRSSTRAATKVKTTSAVA